MEEGTKQGIVAAIVGVILATILCISGVKCNHSDNNAMIDCIKITQKPLECKTAIRGGN